MQKQALINIFLILFIDILSFAMVIPLSPILAREFQADGLQVGFLISIYSIVQFLVAPYWGRASDKIGRKPVLLIGILGVALSHLLFAFSKDLLHLFLSRAMAGFFGANIVIGMAYIADVTKAEERSKNLGIIGTAFGLGFTFGPALGFLFIILGKQLGPLPPFGESFAAVGATCIGLLNFILSFVLIKDVYKPVKGEGFFQKSLKPHRFKKPSPYFTLKALREPKLKIILLMSFILWIGLAKIEPILILFVQDDFGWQKKTAYFGFAYIGLLMAFSQAYLIRQWIPAFGEKLVNQYGLLLFCIGLFLLGLSSLNIVNFLFLKIALLVLGVTLFIIGYSLSSTSLSGAISLLSPSQYQGGIFGIHQSFIALARITGPILGGLFYRDVSHQSPFFLAACIGFFALCLALWMGSRFPQRGSFLIKANKKAPHDSLSLLPLHEQEKDFSSINAYQLKNLVEKRVLCLFFCLEQENKWKDKIKSHSCYQEKQEQKNMFSENYIFQNQDFITKLDKQLQFKTEKNILDILQHKEKNQPVVLICFTGLSSKKMVEKLSLQGYINIYYFQSSLFASSNND